MAEDKAPEEEAPPEAPEAAPGPGRRRKLGNVSLHPLEFEEAVDALLAVKMEPEETRGKKKAPPGGGADSKAGS